MCAKETDVNTVKSYNDGIGEVLVCYRYCRYNEDRLKYLFKYHRLHIANLTTLNDDKEGTLICDDGSLALQEKLTSNHGVICYSISDSDYKMWREYGGVFSGVCLEFHIPERYSTPLRKVHYDEATTTIHADEVNMAPADFKAEIEKTICNCKLRKKDAVPFSYECEWRQIFTIGTHMSKSVIEDHGKFYWEFDPQMLKRVIVGFKRVGSEVDSIKGWLKDAGVYEHTQVMSSGIHLPPSMPFSLDITATINGTIRSIQ